MLYYDDMVPGETISGPSFEVNRRDMVEFAKIWDPVPFHIDEEAAQAAFGGLTAPGIYVLAVKQRLIHQLDDRHAVIASLGYDEVRFHRPVRPGDTLALNVEWVERRLSKSKDDRGIVTVRFSLTNQEDEAVMSHLDTILVRLRQPADETSSECLERVGSEPSREFRSR